MNGLERCVRVGVLPFSCSIQPVFVLPSCVSKLLVVPILAMCVPTSRKEYLCTMPHHRFSQSFNKLYYHSSVLPTATPLRSFFPFAHFSTSSSNVSSRRKYLCYLTLPTFLAAPSYTHSTHFCLPHSFDARGSNVSNISDSFCQNLVLVFFAGNCLLR